MAREVKQWITVNGQHVPIFEGESKEEAVKRAVKKTQGTKKTGEKKEPVRKQLKNVPEVVQGTTASELHKKLEEQGLGMESADASSLHYRDFNDEEVSLYDAYGNEYRGVFTKGKGGGYEVTGIHKEWHNRKPTDTYSTGVKEKTETQKQISKDNDEKEKQIARNKKEANERTASEKKKGFHNAGQGYMVDEKGNYYKRFGKPGEYEWEVGEFDSKTNTATPGGVNFKTKEEAMSFLGHPKKKTAKEQAIESNEKRRRQKIATKYNSKLGDTEKEVRATLRKLNKAETIALANRFFASWYVKDAPASVLKDHMYEDWIYYNTGEYASISGLKRL